MARIIVGPGIELFLVLAALLGDADVAELPSEAGRRVLSQARRKLDQGFRRRVAAVSAAPEFWLALAAVAGADGLTAADPSGAVDAFASAPLARLPAIPADPAGAQAAAADVLRRFDRLAFASLWRQLRDELGADAASLEARLQHTDPLALLDALGIDRALARDRELILLPSAFAPRGYHFAFDRILAVPVVAGRWAAAAPMRTAPPRRALDRAPDVAAVFAALGDATRCAIAGLIARTPMTGAELARRLGTAAPTMTHHLRVLREAGLLLEQPQGNRVPVSLDRAAIAGLSEAALAKFFGSGEAGMAEPVVRRSRRRRV